MYLFDLTLQDRVIIGISAMILLFSGFLISFITSQRKKLQYHKDLQQLNSQQQQMLREQNALLEQRVSDRTAELNQQKEALQASLTELKTAQIQLIQKEKMASLGELTAGIAHEIQNPLNFVNNFSEVSAELVNELKDELARGKPEEAAFIADDLRQNLQKISQHGGRAAAIVRGMLEHSRTSTGEKRPTNLNALAEEYLKIAYQGWRSMPKNTSGSLTDYRSEQAEWKPIECTLITELDPNLGLFDVIPQEIGRVLLNLYNNAFYAVGQRAKQAEPNYQPTVRVCTQRQNKSLQIRVIDNGTGIPEAIRQKIFQPFFTTKPAGQGTGLGLSLSYDIVTKQYGGTLTVESATDTQTEFVVELPTSTASH